MPLTDTFLRLAVNTAHPKVAAMTPEARKNVVVTLWVDSSGFNGHYPGEGATKINGLGGFDSRMAATSRGLSIGASRPHEMPLSRFSGLNRSTVGELSRLIEKGLLTATLINRGTTVGTTGSSWRDGFLLTAEEISNYTIYPRSVWTGLAAAGVAPAADEDNFIYLPFTGGKLQVQVTDTTANGGDHAITLYGFNPVDSSVVELFQTGVTVGNIVYEIDSPQFSHIIPVPTTLEAGLDLDIALGVSIAPGG